MSRWIAHVRDIIEPTVHYLGPPPGLIEGAERVAMPDAAWVVMETNKDGVFLIRYNEDGEFAGDTWTPTRDLALSVAAEEYGLVEQDWIEVPENITDPVSFGRSAGLPKVQ